MTFEASIAALFDETGRLIQSAADAMSGMTRAWREEDAMGSFFHVDQVNGSDDGDGSVGSPFRSLRAAVQAAGRHVTITLLSNYTIGAYDAGDLGHLDLGERMVILRIGGRTLTFGTHPLVDASGISVGDGLYQLWSQGKLLFHAQDYPNTMGSIVVPALSSTGLGDQQAWAYRRNAIATGRGKYTGFSAGGFWGQNISIGASACCVAGGGNGIVNAMGSVSGYSVVARLQTNTTIGAGGSFAEHVDVLRGYADDGTL